MTSDRVRRVCGNVLGAGLLASFGMINYVAYNDWRHRNLFEKVCTLADTDKDGKLGTLESSVALGAMWKMDTPFISKTGFVSSPAPIDIAPGETGTLHDVRYMLTIPEMEAYLAPLPPVSTFWGVHNFIYSIYF